MFSNIGNFPFNFIYQKKAYKRNQKKIFCKLNDFAKSNELQIVILNFGDIR